MYTCATIVRVLESPKGANNNLLLEFITTTCSYELKIRSVVDKRVKDLHERMYIIQSYVFGLKKCMQSI
jgi:hypothetical protein